MTADSQVVTELTIDAGSAEEGAAQFEQAMADAEAAINKMVAALTGSTDAFGAAGNGLVGAGAAASSAASSYQDAADAADTATSAHRGFASSLSEVSTIAELASKGISLFASSGLLQMAALGGSAALVSSNFQNAFGSVATSAATLLSSIALPLRAIAGIVVAVEGLSEITQLGISRMHDLLDLSSQIDKAGTSSDFYQRQQKAAADFAISADSATKALTKFNELSQADLGGSSLDKTLKQLEDAGNFSNNAGVAAYNNATNVEQQWSAIVTLITTAMNSGERLAALNLASKFLPPDMINQLRANSDFLEQFQQAATAVKPVDLISEDQRTMAIDINTQIKAAQDELATKWKPITDDLAAAGLNYENSWIQIYGWLAKSADAISTIYTTSKSAIQAVEDGVSTFGNLSIWKSLSGGPGLPGALIPTDAATSQQDAQMSAATSQLGAGLRDPSNLLRASLQSTNVEMAVFGDTSKDLANATNTVRDAWERAVTTLEKATLTLQADVLTTGQSTAATKEMRSELQLLEAAKVADHDVTQAQISAYTTLRATMSVTTPWSPPASSSTRPTPRPSTG